MLLQLYGQNNFLDALKGISVPPSGICQQYMESVQKETYDSNRECLEESHKTNSRIYKDLTYKERLKKIKTTNLNLS